MAEREGVQLFRGRTPTGTEVLLVRFVPELDDDRPFLEMFLAELGVLTVLRHPNVARLIEIGYHGTERFLVTEYIDGITLGGVAPLDRDIATWIIAEACAGLHVVHELGLEHGDVKPSNVMIARDGAIKLIDVRLSRLSNRSLRMARGIFKDRYSYLSPEQCLGKRLDRRTDVWSLGVTLYELCAHKRLFSRDSDFDTLNAIAKLPIPPLEENFAPALEAIVMTALERDPDDRYATALEMRDALLAVIGDDDRREDVAAAIARL